MSETNIISGSKAVLEAILAGKTIDKIFIDKEAKNIDYQPIFNAIRYRQIPCSRVPTAKLNKLVPHNHQGIVAVLSPVPLVSLSHIVQDTYEKGKLPLIVILDGVTDVGNLGAIIRTSVCVGADALVIPKQNSASLGSGAMKTSAGALAYLPICREANLQATINYLQNSGLQVIACHEKTKTSIYQTNLTVPTAILLGSEDKGIQPQLLGKVDGQAAIPMVGPIGSLNVSVAAAIILYESLRQRNSI
jgi:23S rRNA (guanosine2251-2'-O)-methyltransferase